MSIALIFFDQRSVPFHAFRNRVASAVSYPFQWMVDSPINFVHWINASITSQNHLLGENEKLHMREILLQSRLQKLLSLEQENAQLRQLLQSTPQVSGRVVVARLLAVELDPNLQQVVLNKGSNDNVYEGQPVLDAFGVMGQIIGVGSLTSRVQLITDRRSAVPVVDYRTGMRAIAVGMGSSGHLKLRNAPNEADIQLGDLFVTSGLGLCYPLGYPVGIVKKITQINNLETEIVLSPTAHLNQTEQVLLAWPDEKKLSDAIQQELTSNQHSSESVSKTVTKPKTSASVKK